MYETNGMNYNFVIVECTLYGIECGCWEHFKENGLVVDAKAGDAGKQGIHLLNPTQDEIDDAIERCERDGFSTIYRHTARTWPKGKTELKLAKG